MLKADQVSFRYDNGNRKILNRISMTLERGERLGLTAPSGFGKTTFCKILSGYEQPDSGTLTLDGRPLSLYKGYCPIQMIWQHPALSVNPRLKMRQILTDAGGLSPKLLNDLGIKKEWMDRYPSELSGGELQRFCIARALGKETRFLLADEMSAMLDLITQQEIWCTLLREAGRRGIGLLVVSHSEGLLDRVCDRRLDLTKEM